MPASKTKHYSTHEKNLAQLGRAFAHPARIRILKLLDENIGVRNKDLTQALKLNKATVHNHLNKLKDAKLINSSFFQRSLWVTKNRDAEDRLKSFLDSNV